MTHTTTGQDVAARSRRNLDARHGPGRARIESQRCAASASRNPLTNLTDVYASSHRLRQPVAQGVECQHELPAVIEPATRQLRRFADDARYSLHITDPRTGATKIRYDFVFSPVNANYKNPTRSCPTARHQVGAIQTVAMRARTSRRRSASSSTTKKSATTIGQSLSRRPRTSAAASRRSTTTRPAWRCRGRRRSPGSTSNTRSTIPRPASARWPWAGYRDDSFYSDIPASSTCSTCASSTTTARCRTARARTATASTGSGLQRVVDRAADPFSELESRAIPATYDTVFFGRSRAWASMPCQPAQVTVRKPDGSVVNSGGWMQVARLGTRCSPKACRFKDKDRFQSHARDAGFGRSRPTRGNPNSPTLINAVYGTSFAATNRADLEKIFIPEVLRVVDDDRPGQGCRAAGLPSAGVHRR